eukprot:GEMP01067816.1.p1 GENE.GEMP01067816.1~~GEMP01067816.1.p1  ORF type:complete len:254 (+),score=38.58 GEMP01067816.1:30-764(+)
MILRMFQRTLPTSESRLCPHATIARRTVAHFGTNVPLRHNDPRRCNALTLTRRRLSSYEIPGRKQYLSCLPEWAHTDKAPRGAKWLVALSLAPLAAGTVWIHMEKEDPSPREVMRMEIHYLSMTLAYVGAIHWGLQLTEFAMPPTSPYMAIYYFMRFGLPIVPMSLAWLSSSMSAVYPRDAVMWLGTAYASMYGMDVLAHLTCTTPAWYAWVRGAHTLGVFLSLAGLLLSEHMLEQGRVPQLKM